MEATTATPIGWSDADLAHRHRYGDEEAFAEVYRRHLDMVYNLAYRMSGKREDAEDLAQEVFLRIHRHLGRFRGGSSLKTWIYRVTLNHCRSKLGRKRLPFRSLEPERGEERGPVIPDTRRDPEDRALASDAGSLVHRALASLPTVFREAVILRDLEGLSYEEISEVLDVRIGTVRSRIARGRDQLRAAVEDAS